MFGRRGPKGARGYEVGRAPQLANPGFRIFSGGSGGENVRINSFLFPRDWGKIPVRMAIESQ